MFRSNFVINFGKIDEIADGANNYKNSLDSLESALKSFSSVVENNSGAAANEMNRKVPDINSYIKSYKEGLGELNKILNSYNSEMTAIIAPVSEGADMLLNTREIRVGLKNLNNQLSELKSLVSSNEIPTISKNSFTTENETIATYSQEYINESIAKIEKMKSKQEHVKQIVDSLCSKYLDDMDKIAKKVEQFADLDSDFENQAEVIYKDYADIPWWDTMLFKGIVVGVLVIGSIVVIVLGASIGIPAAAVGIATKLLFSLGETVVISFATAICKKEDIESVVTDDLYIDGVMDLVTLGIGDKFTKAIDMGMDWITDPKLRKFIENNKDLIANSGKDMVANLAAKGEVKPIETIAGNYMGKEIDNVFNNALGELQDIDKRIDNKIDTIDDKFIDRSKKIYNQGKEVVKNSFNVLKNEVKDVGKYYINESVGQMKEGEVPDVEEMDPYEGKYTDEDKLKDYDKLVERFVGQDKKEEYFKNFFNYMTGN